MQATRHDGNDTYPETADRQDPQRYRPVRQYRKRISLPETDGCTGIPSAKVEIGDFDGKPALIVERFDRRWTRDSRLLRLPQEDCCQALSVPPTSKYQSEGGPGIRDILDLLKGSDDPEATRRPSSAQPSCSGYSALRTAMRRTSVFFSTQVDVSG